MKNKYYESDVEDFIWSNIKDKELLARFGLYLNEGLYFRQYAVQGCGVFDIVGFSVKVWTCIDGSIKKDLVVDIYELKRNALKCADVGQVSRYIDCMRQNSLEFLKMVGFEGFELVVYGHLIGNGIERDAIHSKALIDGLLDVYTYDFTNGISFNPVFETDFLSSVRGNVSVDNVKTFSLSDISEAGGVENIDLQRLERVVFANKSIGEFSKN